MSVHAGEPIQDAQKMIFSDQSLNFNSQRGLGEHSGGGNNYRTPPVGGLIEGDVVQPYLVRELHSLSIPRGGASPHAGAISPGNPHT